MALFNWLKAGQKSVRSGRLQLAPETRFGIFWIILLVFLFIFWISRSIVAPFIWAVITAYLFFPLIDLFEEKTRLHRIFWILLVYIVVGGLVAWGAIAWWPELLQEIQDIVLVPKAGGHTIVSRMVDASSITIFGIQFDLRQVVREVQLFIKEVLPNQLVPFAANLLELVIHFVVFLMATFYILADADHFLRRGVKLVHRRYRREVVSLASKINQTIGAYIRGLVVLIVIMSIGTFIALSILRIQYAAFLSLATGFLEVIPVVGPIAAATLTILVVFQQPSIAFGLSHVSMAGVVGLVYLSMRLFEDYLIIPNVVGRFVHVHPLVAIFALMVGAQYGGILGLFIALPVAAVLKVIFTYFYEKLVEEPS